MAGYEPERFLAGDEIADLGLLGQHNGESAESDFPGQGSPAAQMGQRGGPDVAEQVVGAKQVGLGSGGVDEGEVIHRVLAGTGQGPPDAGLDRSVELEPLQAGGRGLQGWLVGHGLGEDHLEDQGQGVAGGPGLDDVEDGDRRLPERQL
jgi:hypothetical protein